MDRVFVRSRAQPPPNLRRGGVSCVAFVVALWASFAAMPAWAHDPLDITAKIQVQKERIGVQITLAWSTTRLLLNDGKPGAPPLPPDRFDEIKSALERRAAAFLVFTSKATRVGPRQAKAELTDDGDVKIDLDFGRPNTPHLRVEGALLKILPEHGYHIITTIYGPAEGHIWHDVLAPEKLALEVVSSAP